MICSSLMALASDGDLTLRDFDEGLSKLDSVRGKYEKMLTDVYNSEYVFALFRLYSRGQELLWGISVGDFDQQPRVQTFIIDSRSESCETHVLPNDNSLIEAISKLYNAINDSTLNTLTDDCLLIESIPNRFSKDERTLTYMLINNLRKQRKINYIRTDTFEGCHMFTNLHAMLAIMLAATLHDLF